jgi:hypothetical protein
MRHVVISIGENNAHCGSPVFGFVFIGWLNCYNKTNIKEI